MWAPSFWAPVTYEFVLAEIEKGGGWPYMDGPT